MIIPATIIAAAIMMAEMPDTLLTATVVADRAAAISRTDTLSLRCSGDAGGVLQTVPGLSVSDNGGYSGLKTVSLRGMGSPNTVICIDGVRVGNIQSGQSDLGTLGIENFSSVVIDYSRGSLSFNTRRPDFHDGRSFGGDVALQAGSFGTRLPSMRVGWKLSDKLTLSANAAAVLSEGDFNYGEGLSRENNDIRQVRGGVDLFGAVEGGEWHAKVWCNASERGTPGPVSYPSDDRQEDANMLVQGTLQKRFSINYHLSASAKLARDDIYYSSLWGDSGYEQTEAQFNSTHRFRVGRLADLSVTADMFGDRLNSSVYVKSRVGLLSELVASVHTKRLKAETGLRYETITDGGRGLTGLSPSFDLRYSAPGNVLFSGYARRSCRFPTFNELYYVGYGNPDLKPEDAWLSGAGMGFDGESGNWSMKARADIFLNILRNKISSAPNPDDPAIWSPFNIGKVRSSGYDVLAALRFSDCGREASFTAEYCFLDAVDRTAGSEACGTRIPYVARHTLSMDASAGIRGWSADVLWILRAGRSDSYGEMSDWSTLDLYFRKTLDFGILGGLTLSFILRNVLDCRAESVSGYPLPGFNLAAGMEYSF